MRWWAVDLTTDEPLREQAAAWLVAATGQAVEERPDGCIAGSAPDADTAAAIRDQAQATFGNAVQVALREMPPADWTTKWREGMTVRRVGRMALVPSWLEVPEDAPAHLVIDPEMAFGSGEHGSTRAALLLLHRHLTPNAVVLDLGSGSGILAIAAVLLGARQAIGIENDAEANPVALRNADRNGVASRVRIVEGDAMEWAPRSGPAELVVSNILRGPNVQLLPAIHAALVPGGLAIFAGMEVPEAELFRPELLAAGFTPVDEAVDEGWWAIAARRA